MTSPLVLITDCDHPDVAIERTRFAAAGLRVALAQCRTADDVAVAGADASALVTQYAPVTAQVLERLPQVRVVARYGAGLDNIDLEATASRSVRVISVPDYSIEEVSNHAIALTIAHVRGVVRLDRAVHEGRWDFRAAGPLARASELCFGVVGLGRIGAAVAAKAQVLGFRVVGFDVSPRELAGIVRLDLDSLCACSDVISLHVPLSAETHHLFDHRRFALMKRGALLVNTSRGGLVDRQALLAALDSGRLGGAALDVLEPEPPDVDDPLLRDPRVIITPHAAFYSEGSLEELKRRVADGVVAALGESALAGAADSAAAC
jgi:D-3-phosphoglycerate dehydrogenase